LDSFSFERNDYRGDLSHFWRSIGLALEAGFDDWTPTAPIDSQQTFLRAFLRKDWNQEIVLLIDEVSDTERRRWVVVNVEEGMHSPLIVKIVPTP
jgi:hypothetical protein